MRMRGRVCPKFRKQPEEHIGPNVAVVTTSTSSAAAATPFLST